ncbi:MAG: hypothetical protein RBR08_09280 [Desulforegulaceae bacterium]|jgi:hypothetical protein|nr:hypothetical protein [Desulforegulaceae bacterium]
MKKIIPARFFIAFIILALISGCAKGYKTELMRYDAILDSGEFIEVTFYFYFTDKQASKKAAEKNDKFIHALNLMFNSYKKPLLTEPKINNILKKCGNMVFDNSVAEVEIKSIKYRN